MGWVALRPEPETGLPLPSFVGIRPHFFIVCQILQDSHPPHPKKRERRPKSIQESISIYDTGIKAEIRTTKLCQVLEEAFDALLGGTPCKWTPVPRITTRDRRNWAIFLQMAAVTNRMRATYPHLSRCCVAPEWPVSCRAANVEQGENWGTIF